MRWGIIAALVLWCGVGLAEEPAADVPKETDPLPSWQDRDARRQIIEYVEKVTNSDSDQYIPAAERVAVFDNDGTLWCESPLPIQLAHIIDEVKKQAKENVELKRIPPSRLCSKATSKVHSPMVWMDCCDLPVLQTQV